MRRHYDAHSIKPPPIVREVQKRDILCCRYAMANCPHRGTCHHAHSARPLVVEIGREDRWERAALASHLLSSARQQKQETSGQRQKQAD